jgi:hypothetical protein
MKNQIDPINIRTKEQILRMISAIQKEIDNTPLTAKINIKG